MPVTRHDALFKWRDPQKDMTPESLVACLSVEALPHGDVRSDLLEAVVAFRHLSSAGRLAAAKKYYREKGATHGT